MTTPEGTAPKQRKRALPYVGFNKLRPGRIHMFCIHCKRKLSNMVRYPEDPPTAVLVKTWCRKCQEGCKDVPEHFFDAYGRELEWKP